MKKRQLVVSVVLAALFVLVPARSASAALLRWQPDGPVRAIVSLEQRVPCTILVLGDFLYWNGPAGQKLYRPSAAIVNLCLNGRPTPWSLAIDGGIEAAAVKGGVLYVAGGFSEINGRLRSYMAAFRLADMTLLGWSPHGGPDIPPFYALAVSDAGVVWGGGGFTSVFTKNDRQFCPWLAGFTGRSGQLTCPGGPYVTGDIHSLSAIGRSLWQCGDYGVKVGTAFGQIPDAACSAINALDEKTALAGDDDGTLRLLAVSGNGLRAKWSIDLPGQPRQIQAAGDGASLVVGDFFIALVENATGHATVQEASGRIWAAAMTSRGILIGGRDDDFNATFELLPFH